MKYLTILGCVQLGMLSLIAAEPGKAVPKYGCEVIENKDRDRLVALVNAEVILPKIELQNATFNEAMAYLRINSRKGKPESFGINVVIKPRKKDPPITLRIGHPVPYFEALDLMCQRDGYIWKIDSTGLV